ncbi:hypothetical protein F4780DRAFT_417371 [Xylariomycetidae sp. FL0641]|nr:hypothetical protein F4780DRAFT_417371 [Xylariomycetidae sp. FL0641]
MDSKSASGLAPPPAYTLHPSDSTGTSQAVPKLPNTWTSHLQHHLSCLPERIRNARNAHAVQQELDDSLLIEQLAPDVEAFLARLGRLHPAPALATLILVPETAVPPHATSSEADEVREGDVCEYSRVKMPNTTKPSDYQAPKGEAGRREEDQDNGDASWSVRNQFSDWGRFGDSTSSVDGSGHGSGCSWWQDEEMAGRLAGYLRPQLPREDTQTYSPPVQVAVEQQIPAQKEKKDWDWGSWKGYRSGTRVSKGVASAGESTNNKSVAKQGQRRACKEPRMLTMAREVDFVVQSDLGLLESIRGWAVVVEVRIRG